MFPVPVCRESIARAVKVHPPLERVAVLALPMPLRLLLAAISFSDHPVNTTSLQPTTANPMLCTRRYSSATCLGITHNTGHVLQS